MTIPEEGARPAAPVGGAAGTGWRRVVLSGGLTVREAEARRTEFLAVLADAGRIELETRGLDAVDVAGLQLLIALRHSAREAGRAVRLAAPPDGALLRALIGAGFWVGGGVGGEPVVARDRFWLGEV